MKTVKRNFSALAGIVGATILIGVAVFTVLADTPAPVMTIRALGGNQFSVTITNNSDTNVNYELYWTPILNDAGFPWQLLIEGNPGQTNFTFNGGTYPVNFFQTRIGSDADGDGIPNSEDADPNNPAVGVLNVTITFPLDGSIVQ